MIFENCRERRGEPVLFTDRDGETHYGTIEWGDDRRGYSVCCEPAGRREIVKARDIIPDPNGDRPLWKRRRARELGE